MNEMHERARFHCLEVTGSETARELFYALLEERGHPYIEDVTEALDDLGLEVFER